MLILAEHLANGASFESVP